MTCGRARKRAFQYLVGHELANGYLVRLNESIPGCNVASTTFFADHNSGVMPGMRFCL